MSKVIGVVASVVCAVVGMAGIPQASAATAASVHGRTGYSFTASGYWEIESDGQVFALGDAVDYTPEPPLAPTHPVVGAVRTVDGGGYWLAGSDGGVYAYGDAGFYGSTGALRLNRPIVGMAATQDGRGYWLVASDGGIFSYGDAGFYGSTGALTLNKPIVGMAAGTTGGHGYWLVASDGGIFSFGDAGFYGSAGSLSLNAPVTGMTASPDGAGYALVAADGGLFNYGDAESDGSYGGVGYPATTVAVVAQSPALGTLALGTPFDGSRYHHDLFLTVAHDGRFELTYRTTNCGSQAPGAPCDNIVGNLIIDGGHAGGRLTSISGNTATAVITYDPGALLSGPDATMTYDPTNDEITFAATNFCGTASPPDCGA